MMASIINNDLQQQSWCSYSTTDELEQAASLAILHAAQQAINQRGNFRIVLAGGKTPHGVYASLRNANADWAAWHVYFGDERCLPPSHPERNSRMAALAWLDHVAIPADQIHLIAAESGAEIAANEYAKIVGDIEQLDLVLLGLGEDGHTASLFPDHDWGVAPSSPGAIAVHNAPKPPSDRVSLSAHRLSAARQVIFLVAGKEKRHAVREWRNGACIPAASITPACEVEVYIEAAILD